MRREMATTGESAAHYPPLKMQNMKMRTTFEEQQSFHSCLPTDRVDGSLESGGLPMTGGYDQGMQNSSASLEGTRAPPLPQVRVQLLDNAYGQ